jgi:hypothetical protein
VKLEFVLLMQIDRERSTWQPDQALIRLIVGNLIPVDVLQNMILTRYGGTSLNVVANGGNTDVRTIPLTPSTLLEATVVTGDIILQHRI